MIWRISVINPVMPDMEAQEWKKTESGLEYTVLEEGDGPMAKENDNVKAFYTGWMFDGTLFDTSAGGAPIEFPLAKGQLIDGWVEGMQLVKAGSRVLLRIPAELAYAERGKGSIPPNTPLLFDIHLVEVVK